MTFADFIIEGLMIFYNNLTKVRVQNLNKEWNPTKDSFLIKL